MLPDFYDNGNLPPGIHRCLLAEVVARFGRGSPEREVETTELVAFTHWARQAGIKRLLVDGSYVTRKQSPNDVDLVILPGPEQPEQAETALDMANTRPFLHIQVALDAADLEQWAVKDFGIDRSGIPRGVVEIEL